MRIKIVSFISEFLLASTAAFGGPKDDARKLGEEVVSYLMTSFACQQYLGGDAHYQVAKEVFKSTYTRLTGDKNQAVIKLNELDVELKSSNAQERLANSFEKTGLDYTGRVGVCQDMISESQDKIELLQARLGMLQ